MLFTKKRIFLESKNMEENDVPYKKIASTKKNSVLAKTTILRSQNLKKQTNTRTNCKYES